VAICPAKRAAQVNVVHRRLPTGNSHDTSGERLNFELEMLPLAQLKIHKSSVS
jgi:hypothetical protein